MRLKSLKDSISLVSLRHTQNMSCCGELGIVRIPPTCTHVADRLRKTGSGRPAPKGKGVSRGAEGGPVRPGDGSSVISERQRQGSTTDESDGLHGK